MTLFSSNLYKSENCTLTVYKSKPKIKVLLLNTKHTGVRIEDNYKRIPETITFYNKTKYGVDVVDQMARKYSMKAGSFRWPIQVFFNILDLVAINAWILYKEYTRSKISRKEFIFCLAEELAGKTRTTFAKDQTLHFCHLQCQKCEKVAKWVIAKKIEVIIIVYIAKRSYAENAQTTLSIFAKNVLNRYDYPVPLMLLLFFSDNLKKDFLFINNLFKCEA